MTAQTQITFVGHGTILITHGEDRVIFDPMLRKKLLWLNRRDEPVFDFHDLWQTQTIVITSPRFGRFDPHSFKFFKQKTTRVVLPVALENYSKRFFHFDTLPINQEQTISSGLLTLTALPRPHQSWRCFQRHNQAWHFIIQTPVKTVFYASDGGYDKKHFADLASRHKIDVAIVPIDALQLNRFGQNLFLTPEDAAQAFSEVKARQVIPVHYGAFSCPNQKDPGALMRFQGELDKLGLTENACLLKAGESLTL